MLDAVRERKPLFSPEAVVAEFVDLVQSYGLAEVTGDRYGGEWPREQFRKLGVSYRLAERNRSELYTDMLPRLNSGLVDLLDLAVLVNQIVGLERRVARGGRETIDHAPDAHDDVANAVALAVWVAANTMRVTALFGRWGRPEPEIGSATFSGLDDIRQQKSKGLWNNG